MKIALLLPDYAFRNVAGIDKRLLSKKKLLIIDIDNTLVIPETLETTKAVIEWMRDMNKTHYCVCISNSRTWKQRRGRIANIFGCKTAANKRKKPSKKLFSEITQKYGVSSHDVAVIGDRIFTDILFGNMNGATTVLVEPLSTREHLLIRGIRSVERIILHLLERWLKRHRSA